MPFSLVANQGEMRFRRIGTTKCPVPLAGTLWVSFHRGERRHHDQQPGTFTQRSGRRLRATATVPRTAFEPMVRSALMIRPPESTHPGTREADDWATLEAGLHDVCNRYAGELGHTAYAVLNAITDFASHPPENRHLRRDRHGLQRLAGSWLTTFTHESQQPGFAIDTYLAKTEASSQAASVVTA